MGQRINFKLADVLAAVKPNDIVTFERDDYEADDQFPAKTFWYVRVALIGHSFDWPNLSFALDLHGDNLSMDYNEWSEGYEVKREFVKRLDAHYFIA